ncbi:MAG TPA: hypothetical protein DCR40_04245 [Prolixibacteraceae bacterium]|nr:hypothetical protein [Prolixibacteraceae bacterium]
MNQTAELKAKGRKPRYVKPDAVKYLESLAFEAKKIRLPNTPIRFLAKDEYRDDTTSGLMKAITDFLKLSGYKAEQINRRITTKTIFTNVIGHQRSIIETHWIKNGINEMFDISTIIGEITVRIRISRDLQSHAQVTEEAGLISVTVTSFEQFLKFYNLKFQEGNPC